MSPAEPYEKHIIAAEGYVELGMHLDANEELEQLEPENRILPAVMAIRIQIYRALEKWELMQTVAKILALHEPGNVQWTVDWAYATRRADSTEAARSILLEAVERIPTA